MFDFLKKCVKQIIYSKKEIQNMIQSKIDDYAFEAVPYKSIFAVQSLHFSVPLDVSL